MSVFSTQWQIAKINWSYAVVLKWKHLKAANVLRTRRKETADSLIFPVVTNCASCTVAPSKVLHSTGERSNWKVWIRKIQKSGWTGDCAADACAHGDTCQIGGFIRFPSGTTVWFSEKFSYTDLQHWKFPSPKICKNVSHVSKPWHRWQPFSNSAAVRLVFDTHCVFHN